MNLFKLLLLLAFGLAPLSSAVAGPNSCAVVPAEIKNFQKINGRMFTVQSDIAWPQQYIVNLYMEDLSQPLAQPLVLNKRNKVSITHQYASRLVNNLSQAPGIMRFDKVPAGTYRISVVHYDTCGTPVRQAILSSSVTFSGQAIAESAAPVIQNISVQSYMNYPYIKFLVADIDSGLARVELWADGQFAAEIYPEGRHGADNLNGATRAIYSLSGGLFDYRITPSFSMAGKNVQIKAFDVHGNVAVSQVP